MGSNNSLSLPSMQGDPLQVSPNDFKFGIKQEVLENNEAGRD